MAQDSTSSHTMRRREELARPFNVFIEWFFFFLAQAVVVFALFAFDHFYGADARHLMERCGNVNATAITGNSTDSMTNAGAMTTDFNLTCDTERDVCISEAARFGTIEYFERVIILLWAKFGVNVCWSSSIAYRFLIDPKLTHLKPALFMLFLFMAAIMVMVFAATDVESSVRLQMLPFLIFGTEAVSVSMLGVEIFCKGRWQKARGLVLFLLIIDMAIAGVICYVTFLMSAQSDDFGDLVAKAANLLRTIQAIAGLIAFVYASLCFAAEEFQARHTEPQLQQQQWWLKKMDRCIFYACFYAAMVGAMVSSSTMYNVILVLGGPVTVLRVYTSLHCHKGSTREKMEGTEATMMTDGIQV